MRKKTNKTRKKTGLSPGSLVHTGERFQEKVSLQLIKYDLDSVDTYEESSLDKLLEKLDSKKVNWINVNGLHDVSLIEKLGRKFDIHPLVLEDILQVEHMPKFEDYESYLFLTLKMLGEASGKPVSYGREHLSMILGDYFLITFQETEGDVFDVVRESLKNGTGRLRRMGPDYLFYRLIDVIVDHYFLVSDNLEEELDDIEELLLQKFHDGISEKIMQGKKRMIFIRRSIFPLKDELRKLRQSDTGLIRKGTYRFIDDVYDHLQHIVSTNEGFRDLVTSLLELHMSVNSNRMNNVMKTLTIFAAIFMPLTFIAGIYGMNFEYMPELGLSWAYPAVLFLMLTVALAMLIYMRFKKWL